MRVSRAITAAVAWSVLYGTSELFARARGGGNSTNPGNPAVDSFLTSSAYPVFMAIALVGFVGLVWWLNESQKPKPVDPEELNRLQTEADVFFKNLSAGNIVQPDVPIILESDEKAVLNEPSTLTEARATRVYGGAGTSIKGVHFGGGESRSFQSLKQIDSGTLTITTRRLIFTGTMESRVTKAKDIVSAKAWDDAIEVSSQKRMKSSIYSVRNPLIWSRVVQMAAKGAQR